jgi:hypothetical protein
MPPFYNWNEMMPRTFSGNGIGLSPGGICSGSGDCECELLNRLLPEGVDGSSVALRFASVVA